MGRESGTEEQSLMKSLGFALLLFAIVASTSVEADSAFKGTFVAEQPFTILVDNPNLAGKAAVTVTYYLTGGEPSTQSDVHIVPAGHTGISFVQLIPKGARLVVINVVPVSNGFVGVGVVQGTFSVPQQSGIGEFTLTFDVQ
jgi:hypothetical protein